MVLERLFKAASSPRHYLKRKATVIQILAITGRPRLQKLLPAA